MIAGLRTQSAQRLIVTAYILACAMPPLGLILGIVVALRVPRPGSKHWPWIILLSIVAAAIWAVIISNGALSSTNSNY